MVGQERKPLLREARKEYHYFDRVDQERLEDLLVTILVDIADTCECDPDVGIYRCTHDEAAELYEALTGDEWDAGRDPSSEELARTI